MKLFVLLSFLVSLTLAQIPGFPSNLCGCPDSIPCFPRLECAWQQIMSNQSPDMFDLSGPPVSPLPPPDVLPPLPKYTHSINSIIIPHATAPPVIQTGPLVPNSGLTPVQPLFPYQPIYSPLFGYQQFANPFAPSTSTPAPQLVAAADSAAQNATDSAESSSSEEGGDMNDDEAPSAVFPAPSPLGMFAQTGCQCLPPMLQPLFPSPCQTTTTTTTTTTTQPPCAASTTTPAPLCPSSSYRRKRAARVVRDSQTDLCNSQELRKIILKNLGDGISESKALIHAELKRVYDGNFVVVCSDANISFTADSSNYCVDGSPNFNCYVFEV